MSDQLFPWFQPIVDVASGRIVGYESLARMKGRDGRVISAAPLLNSEQADPTVRLQQDRALRREALRQFAEMAEPGQTLSLNMSPEWIDSLDSFDLLPTLEMIRDAGVSPDQVIIEITEVNGDIGRICELARRYREAGVRIAFDDFGSGFQQLDRLLAFTPDFIKIDMRMFSTAKVSHQKKALLQMMGDLGARLGSKVVFEGVETEDELFLALHCNASHIQGFIFSPAQPEFLPPESFKEQMQDLLSLHLDLAIEETARRQWHAEGIHSELLALRELLLAGGAEIGTNLDSFTPDPDILRLFICNRQGEQISANWCFNNGHWQADSSVIGSNWSWRPYFYQLVGSSDYQRRVLRSSVYIDIATGSQCHTLTLALDEHRVLLVDVLERAQSPRPMSALISCQSDLIPSLS
ncbi:signal transduction protein [Marinobacterium zhoushanense]|uniref:Signal transduction protein n=1 Tax=Marinobacterium zhoushanense TaxID=1679163 RepID=A0ABQ1K6Y3_9GAMM|nr:EAL domain-containing protein [Marinobacterium zhoushanense]GGB89560.1 signal transduction protein [Marinobacterium zhoushanense]